MVSSGKALASRAVWGVLVRCILVGGCGEYNPRFLHQWGEGRRERSGVEWIEGVVYVYVYVRDRQMRRGLAWHGVSFWTQNLTISRYTLGGGMGAGWCD